MVYFPNMSRPETRRAALHDFKRGQILTAAGEELSRREGPAPSLRGIAERAGYAPAALYSYFPSLDALCVALAGDGLAALTRGLRAADADASDHPPTERLAALLRAALEAAAAAPLDGALLAAVCEPKRRNADAATARQFNGRVIAALRALGAPFGDAPEAAEKTVALASALIGLALLEKSGLLALLGVSRDALIADMGARFGGSGS